MAVFSACMKSSLHCTTSFTASLSLALIPACVSHQCEEYWTLRSGIIWRACQLAISMNSSEPEVIGEPRLCKNCTNWAGLSPTCLFVCLLMISSFHSCPPAFHAVLKFPALSIGYLLLHEMCSV